MSTAETPVVQEDAPPWAAGTDTRWDEMFPTLSDAHIEVLRRAGAERSFANGEWVWQVGDRGNPLYVVLEGAIDVVMRDMHGESVAAAFGPRQFSGETTTMGGRASLVSGRARGNLRTIAVASEVLRELMAVNAELGELLMQAFILRRMRMIARRIGPVTLVGSRYSAETLRLRDFLTRNGTPHEYIDLESADDVECLIEHFHVRPEETPIVLCNGRVLRSPTIEGLAECLGISSRVSEATLYDVAVIGGGPGGLAAAVYASSEGLKVIVVERLAPGGQAGTSSRIENYLGFPTGISGQALAGRAWIQAQKFGTEFALPSNVESLSTEGADLCVALSSGQKIRARTVIIASGVVYRQPEIPGIERFLGGGVHYSASYLESLLCRDQEVAVLGGGNSAGQAAVYLSAHARHVYVVVRGEGLAESMSRYLIHRIETTPNITLLTHTVLTEAVGDTSLQSVRWKNTSLGTEGELPVGHVFIFIGAVPCTDFLDVSVARDDKGFITTGTSLSTGERTRYQAIGGGREPQFLETSWPHVYAIGDVRAGSLKRVAAAVGDGAAVVALVHAALHP